LGTIRPLYQSEDEQTKIRELVYKTDDYAIFIGATINGLNILIDDINIQTRQSVMQTLTQRPTQRPLREATPMLEDDNPLYASHVDTLVRCPVCFVNERNTVLSCGHLICSECAKNPRTFYNGGCPVCRQPVVSKDAIYYKKYLKYRTKYLQLKNIQ